MTTTSAPKNWTEQDIPDQTGRKFVVTGANSGLGEQAVRALAKKNAQVVLAVRNIDKGKAVADSIGSLAEVRSLDLADLSSVRTFADSIDGVDVLVNNAGLMAVPKRRTADGFEMQFGTNHLGHFALTGLLLGRVTDRVVTLSSGAHAIGKIDLDDPNYEHRRYEAWTAYGQSKLANLMFAYELQRRLDAAGSRVKSIAAHPGYAATNLQSHTESFLDRVMAVANKVVAQSAEMGALPELYAATAPEAQGGQFIGPDKLGSMRGHPTTNGSSKRSQDVEVAGKLWDLSEKLTGVRFPV